MSKLQLLAHRCPVMGKALAIQSRKVGKVGFPAVTAVAGLRAFSGSSKATKAKLHTTTSQAARAVEDYKTEKGVCVCACVSVCGKAHRGDPLHELHH